MRAVQPMPHPPRLLIVGNLPKVYGDTIVQRVNRKWSLQELLIAGSRFYGVSSQACVHGLLSTLRWSRPHRLGFDSQTF